MSTSAEPGPRAKGPGSPEKKLGVVEKVLGVISGLLAVVTAVLGVYAASTRQKADDAAGQATTSQHQVQALQDQVRVLRQQAETDQRTISSLRAGAAAPAGSVAPSDTAAPTDGPAAPAVYHQDPLTVVAGTWGVDLDAPPDDHSWTRPGGTKIEFSYERDGDLDIGTWTGGAVLMTGTPSQSACDHASGFHHDPIPATRLERHPFLCFMTTEKRSSLVVVESVTPRELKLDVTTFAAAGD